MINFVGDLDVFVRPCESKTLEHIHRDLETRPGIRNRTDLARMLGHLQQGSRYGRGVAFLRIHRHLGDDSANLPGIIRIHHHVHLKFGGGSFVLQGLLRGSQIYVHNVTGFANPPHS